MRNKAPVIIFIVCFLHFASANSIAAGMPEKIVRTTLNNGLRVVIVPNSLAPVVTTQINYLVGADETPPGFPGMAHAQEHMMFRGSPGLTAAQLSAIIASLGGDFNADTQQTVTQYFFTVPSADLDVALRVEATRMKGISDTEKLWQLERGAIDQEVAQDLSSPLYVFYTKLIASMFRDSPYAHDPLGTSESFGKTTGKMLRKFHRDWYGPNNAILVIAGDVDPAKTLAAVKNLFGPIPPRPTPQRPRVILKPQESSAITLSTDLPYGLVFVGYRLPGYDSADYAAGQILADVLGSKRGEIYALVPKGRAISADFSINTLPKASVGYVTVAFPRGGDGAGLISAVKSIIEDYLQKGFPAELVEAAKRLEIADYEFQQNSVEGLASLWSQALAVEGRNSPRDDIDAIGKVTPEDVQRVAKTCLLNETAVTAILEPLSAGKPAPFSGPRGKESFTPRRIKHVKLPVWARKASVLPPIPASTVHPVVSTLPNGLRLLVQPEGVSDTVSIYGKIKSNPDVQVPEGQEGADRILGALLSYGTETLDRLSFQKALDDIAARESAGRSFSLQVMRDHFEKGVQLLAENLLHPALPEESFRVLREETMGELAGLLQSPHYLSRRAMLAGLYPKSDPALRQATPDTVRKLTLDDIRTYYGEVFRPDMTTIVVIGKVTPEEAYAVIEKHFGGWTARGPKPQTDFPPVSPNKPSSVTVPDASRVQTEVSLAETLGLTRSDPDYYTLEVGNRVLSGAFYATRLYRDLRERSGLVYTVESSLDAGKTRSVFEVFYACDPENVQKARQIVERDLRDMQTKPVTVNELRQAKTILLRRIPLSEASVENIAARLLHYVEEDLPLDEHLRAAKRYREMTAPEIKAAFSKWVRPSDFVQVTLGPQPK